MIAPQLAEWALSPKRVPNEVADAALRHLVDGIGNALGGLRTHAVDPALDVARGLGGPLEATILGEPSAIGAPAASLANGALVHALDFDDTHAGGLIHATAVVLPAAFAVGQQVGATGAEVLHAAVVGYETACRVAAAAPHGFHARGLHATMVGGVFSSAIIAACLMKLKAEQAANALGIAGSQAGGLLAFLGTGASTKQLHPGFASHAGILAARLAAAGATGPETVFDGPHGVFDALAAGPVDPASILDGLGHRWETLHIGIKPYPACQLSHASIDATFDALKRADFAFDQIFGVEAEIHPDSASVVCDTSSDPSRPASPYAAKFSLRWTLAALLHDRRVTLDTFSEASIKRPAVGELARRVRWIPSNSDPHTVAADAPGRVVIELRDGRRIVGSVPHSAGGGDLRLSQDALLAKFLGNAGGAHELAMGLANSVESLAQHATLEPVMDAARRIADQYSPPEVDQP